MSDSVSVASATIALLIEKTKNQESSLGYHKQVKTDVELSRQKFQLWVETWSVQARKPDVKVSQSEVDSKALWGVQGWEHVQKILDTINRLSKDIDAALQENPKPLPRIRWKSAVRALRSKDPKRPPAKNPELKRLAATLNESIDELWLYTETVFDSLHGVMSQETPFPSRERLLASALQSRAGTLELYKLCAKLTVDWSLEMDLRDTGTMPFNSLHEQDDSSRQPFFRLFTQLSDNPAELHKVVVENVSEEVVSIKPKDEVKQVDWSELQMSSLQTLKLRFGDSKSVSLIVSKGSESPSCLRFYITSVPEVRLKTLLSVLETLKKATSNLSVSEHFSIGAKVELAYKVVECGFFLLGTPWFSSLRSKNILRLKSTGSKRHTFILRIQTLNIDDLLFDDAEALTETSQLYRIGVLLAEIALDDPDSAISTEDSGHDRASTSLLPLIEQAMGPQYCKATAFCLQARQQQARFEGLSRYKTSLSQDRESYLPTLLQDYHSQVFARLEELRDIDTKSEYRSQRSFQTN